MQQNSGRRQEARGYNTTHCHTANNQRLVDRLLLLIRSTSLLNDAPERSKATVDAPRRRTQTLDQAAAGTMHQLALLPAILYKFSDVVDGRMQKVDGSPSSLKFWAAGKLSGNFLVPKFPFEIQNLKVKTLVLRKF